VPIVFIHGVAVRDRRAFSGIETLLREYVAPKISNDPAGVDVIFSFWGDHAATFAWDGASLPLPRTAVQGGTPPTAAERSAALLAAGVELPPPRAIVVTPVDDGIAPMGAQQGVVPAPAVTPPTLPIDEVVDLLCAGVAQQLDGANAQEKVASASQDTDYAAAAIAIDRAVRQVAGDSPTLTLDTATLNDIRIKAQLEADAIPALIGTQGPAWVAQLISQARNKVGEVIQSAEDAWGDAMARALFGLRKPLNSFLTSFTGDVFAYIRGRDEGVGAGSAIVGIVLNALKDALASQRRRNGEKIIVFSHSMGGQLIYDALTHYVDTDDDLNKNLKVDLWAAAASQVGLFEELKLFKESKAQHSKASGKVPALPASRCAHWWNVWDPNDFASYTGAAIFNGIDDEEFKSDRTPIDAHGGYLVLPRFYRRMAEKL
jgi:hypothetical protein